MVVLAFCALCVGILTSGGAIGETWNSRVQMEHGHDSTHILMIAVAQWASFVIAHVSRSFISKMQLSLFRDGKERWFAWFMPIVGLDDQRR